MYGSDLVKVVAKALKIPESELPVFPSQKPPVLPDRSAGKNKSP